MRSPSVSAFPLDAVDWVMVNFGVVVALKALRWSNLDYQACWSLSTNLTEVSLVSAQYGNSMQCRVLHAQTVSKL